MDGKEMKGFWRIFTSRRLWYGTIAVIFIFLGNLLSSIDLRITGLVFILLFIVEAIIELNEPKSKNQ